MDQEPNQSRASLRNLVTDSRSWAVSEQAARDTWLRLRDLLSRHWPVRPLFGEMGRGVVVIVTALFLLSSAASILGGRYWAVREDLAREEFERARGLNSQGQHEQALRRLRAAFHLELHNREYQMALTLTLIALGRYDEARLQLNDILRSDPTNAPANLLLARIASNESSPDVDTAIQYYQRSIYGLWPDNPVRHRIDARFELAHYLAEQGRIEQLRAELIMLASDIRDDRGELVRVGYLMLFARSPSQAEMVFARVLSQDSRDAEALAGLGKAQLEMGNFAASERSFLRAARANRGNEEIGRQLALVREIRALNPKRLGLGIYVSAARARNLLELTRDRLAACADPETLPPEARENLTEAEAQLSARRRGAPTVESVDQKIALSFRLFHEAGQSCENPERNEPLERLMTAFATEQ